MLGGKKVYNKCKSEKIRKAHSAHSELLVKIVNDCKLQTIFAKKRHFRCGSEFSSDYNKSMFLAKHKRLISSFFGTVALTSYRDFTSSKSTIKTLKTLEHHVKCV